MIIVGFGKTADYKQMNYDCVKTGSLELRNFNLSSATLSTLCSARGRHALYHTRQGLCAQLSAESQVHKRISVGADSQ